MVLFPTDEDKDGEDSPPLMSRSPVVGSWSISTTVRLMTTVAVVLLSTAAVALMTTAAVALMTTPAVMFKHGRPRDTSANTSSIRRPLRWLPRVFKVLLRENEEGRAQVEAGQGMALLERLSDALMCVSTSVLRPLLRLYARGEPGARGRPAVGKLAKKRLGSTTTVAVTMEAMAVGVDADLLAIEGRGESRLA